MTFLSKNRGYTLLFATLTAAVVLGVAIFISTVARKQYILASTARDSMFAIYNADSALECSSGAVQNVSSDDRFICNNIEHQIIIPGTEFVSDPPAGWGNTYESDSIEIFFFDDPNNQVGTSRGCAIVTMRFSEDIISKQQISARGYNLGNITTGCPAVGPRTVERAMRVTYE
jgi:hypothetical protein